MGGPPLGREQVEPQSGQPSLDPAPEETNSPCLLRNAQRQTGLEAWILLVGGGMCCLANNQVRALLW